MRVRSLTLIGVLAFTALAHGQTNGLLLLGAGPSGAAAAASTLTNNMIGWWELNEAANATAIDAHNTSCGGSGCDLTDNGNVGTTTGKVDAARTFSGDYLSAADHANLRINGDTTWAGWFKTADAGTLTFVAKYDGGGSDEFLFYIAAGDVKLRVYDSSSGFEEAATASGIWDDDAWHFVVGTYTASDKKARIDIDNGTATAVSSALTNGARSGTKAFHVSGSTFPFSGPLDEWAKWDRLLTAGEIACLYNSGNGRSYSAASSGC